MNEQHEHYDDEDTEPQAHAASESGPTTYDQAAWVRSESTGEATQMPDTVVYGEAGVHHETEWTEPTSPDGDQTVTKVVRAEGSEPPTHTTAATKGSSPQRFNRR